MDQSNVYNVLRKFEQNNLIKGRQEKTGKYPARRMYQITSKGKETLRTALLDKKMASQLNILRTLNLLTSINHLPADNLKRHLQIRLKRFELYYMDVTHPHANSENNKADEYLAAVMETEILLK